MENEKKDIKKDDKKVIDLNKPEFKAEPVKIAVPERHSIEWSKVTTIDHMKVILKNLNLVVNKEVCSKELLPFLTDEPIKQ